MNRVRANIVANIAGQGWTVLLALLCTPFYVRFLGVEAYGLIAFFITLQTLLQLLDLGLGVTLNRELARSRQAPADDIPALATTLEAWYWMLGLALGVVLFCFLPTVTLWWLNAEQLHVAHVEHAARAFALLGALQWPMLFYGHGMAGLQRQVAANAVQIPATFLANVGGVLLIWLGPRSVAALLTWQGVVLAAQALLLRYIFWSQAGFRRTQPASRVAMLQRIWRFSAGSSAISVTGVLISHLDKMVLSRILPLESFGHYGLANTVARGLYVLITPVFSAYFPRLSTLVARNDGAAVRHSYRAGTQVMAVLVIPTAAVLVAFAPDVVRLWLRNAELAYTVAPLAMLLVVGTCLNGLMNLPYALQLAHGNTRIGLVINVALVSLLIPAAMYAATRFGAIGAAATWAVANGLYLVVGLPVTHRLLLKTGIGEWALRDVQPAVAASTLLVLMAHRVFVPPESYPALAAFLFAVWCCTTLAAGSVSGTVRKTATHAIRRLA